ncbi:hypothetical protein EZV62_023532 [Acer yangbiense]|uniref:Orn/Lys/Arg decarboxylases family 1 pyridoxal-P attachment site domain-containing protein n=1 Tax=Acer yangbiense TaxID=1000413 RepID=A0A5C7H201_9ROSI|nr:hypothetical protein EZV62_023532 [Acer yangbiense]
MVNALKASGKLNAAGFHFPGHNRGRAAPYSLTEIIGLEPFIHDFNCFPEIGFQFSPQGPISEAQKLAAKLFGALETWFLVGGTTCGIQAAIMATCSPGDYLILPRNSHKSAISALVLSGAIPKYSIPQYNYDWDIASGLLPSQELEKEGQKAGGVFVTSPTYHGVCSKLSEISEVCHNHGIPLIVDEAHGAHFGFHPQLPYSALQQGADLVVQSTHKVLCSLTQSSMLHLSTKSNVDRERISRYLNLDSSSSFPNFPTRDPLRLTLGFWQLGLSGYQVNEILHNDLMVICELVGSRSMTFAFTLGTCREHIQRLVSAIQHVSSINFISLSGGGKLFVVDNEINDSVTGPLLGDIKMGLNPRDAFFSSKRKVSIEESLGKICGELICAYPPGIPLMFPSEIITHSVLDYLVRIAGRIREANFQYPSLSATVIDGASDPSLSSIVICDV